MEKDAVGRGIRKKEVWQKANILEEIARNARFRVERALYGCSREEMKKRALALPKGSFSFEKSLRKSGLSFICECKKASPSKGIIAETFPYLEIAREYEQAGADAISVLTEPGYFLGQDAHLEEIAGTVRLPCLRKDFTVDSYMIYEAKRLGASAILLIAAILSMDELAEYIGIAGELGLSALVEIHDEREAETALAAGAAIVGVNNRSLKDFSVDMDNSRRLRERIPKQVLFVAESGISGPKDMEAVYEIGADAVLVGEFMMRAPDKKEALSRLRVRS